MTWLASLWTWLAHGMIAGAVPVWLVACLCALAVTKKIIQRAKWTKAEDNFDAAMRLILKSPLIGKIVVGTPLVGWCFVWLAGDSEGLPEADLWGFVSKLTNRGGTPPAPPADSSARALLPLALLGVLALSACTSSYTATAASLTAAEHVVAAAAEQFPAIDAAKRKAIVEQARSREEGAANLKAWDAQAVKIVTAIEGANASVKLAADGLKGVHDGLRDPKQLGGWIAPAIKVGADLLNLLHAVGVDIKLGG